MKINVEINDLGTIGSNCLCVSGHGNDSQMIVTDDER